MKKKLIILIFLTILATTLDSANIKIISATELPNEVKFQETTTQTKAEKDASEEKVEIAEKYVQRKKMFRSYNNKKIVSKYGTCVQERPNWCGPATAYNIIQRGNQANSARQLATPRNAGTPFPGNWTTIKLLGHMIIMIGEIT
ncbi:hypothetical protein QJR26_18870 (plasmid) [Clostridium baratii]